ncbi:dephospho-CoA kinase [Neisseria sp.]|uniref:dephospho-CoA kinase n=1 Tax=Neisseria sp. TaxID=192066 RepID=UPI0035A0E185
MTIWIGLTGGIGSGKTRTAEIFAGFGVPCIDADAVSRALTAENGRALPAIRQCFGRVVFDGIGRLNRAALREEVFRRPESKAVLEALMFPLILEGIADQQHRQTNAVYGIIDIPLLVEKPAFRALAARVLVVDVPEDVQILRVRQRSGLAEEEVRRIMAAQASRRDRLLAADDVLCNDGTVNELAEKAVRLNRYYQAVFSAAKTDACPFQTT